MQASDQIRTSYDSDRADVTAIAAAYRATLQAKVQARAEHERKSASRIREFLRNAENARDDDSFVRSNGR